MVRSAVAATYTAAAFIITHQMCCRAYDVDSACDCAADERKGSGAAAENESAHCGISIINFTSDAFTLPSHYGPRDIYIYIYIYIYGFWRSYTRRGPTKNPIYAIGPLLEMMRCI